jgi:nitroreductase
LETKDNSQLERTMDFFETVDTRCSVRAFESCEVPDEDVVRILETARKAPTAFTIEPWHFVVVRDREKIKALGKVQPCVGDAGIVIVAVGDAIKSDFWREDVSAAVQNMHMAATALGYASLWVAALDKSLVSPVLDIPDRLTPLALLPIGKAAGHFKQAPRLEFSSMMHLDSFGTPYNA